MKQPVQRALVTGADGFIGRHLVRELERHGTEVTGLARRARFGSRHISMGDSPWRAEHLAEIIRDAEPDTVFHLAGGTTGTAAELETLNVGLGRAVMEALSRARVRPTFVCCGSAAEYGVASVSGVASSEALACKPASAYGASKLAQTRLALAFGKATGTRVLVARMFNPIGPGMPSHLALGDFARQLAAMPSSGGVLRTGNLDSERDFIDVDWVVRALRLLSQHREAQGVVNICSGRATSLAHLVETLISVSGKPVRLEVAPERVRAGELRSIYGDPSLLWRLTGTLPETDFSRVMARIWEHAAAHAAGGLQWVA